MNIGITLVVQLIAFAIFVWLTMQYIWPLLLRAMEERRAKIADGLAAAERGKKALADAAAEREQTLAQVRGQAQEILGNANRQAGQIIAAARDAARSEGDRIVEAARAQVDHEIDQAREALRKRVGELAVAGAQAILQSEVDARAHGRVLDELAEQL
ncbi:MAG: F0F1 ATP synthase subunit B [Gammaproteobacteria bacterium]|nr:F0F1 ATP synthase subunit B [Gammaproteobacteria bacterium]